MRYRPSGSTHDVQVSALVVAGCDAIAGETIRINAEEMLVESTETNVINVRRAVNGTQLASHSNTQDIFANRLVTVERGATGSTAATSTSGAAITKQVYPSLIEQWCLAEAVVMLSQQTSAYARTSGTGENQAETIGLGLVDIRNRALGTYGRRHRLAAV